MAKPAPRPLRVIFFQTLTGNQPVREWLKDLSDEEKKSIGADILSVQWAWPIGKPLVDSMDKGLWEIRCKLEKRIARVFFIMVDQEIILLHGLIKKSQTAPRKDLELARKRQSTYLAAIKLLKNNENKKGK
jgi:phage-related protein